MNALLLHEFHQALGAKFTEVNGLEVVESYGDALEEHAALREAAGFFDLSFRSRLCLIGADRRKFLHGQVTNDVNRLSVGEGCYAALVNAKGKIQSDLNIYLLENEILLDFEPGYSSAVAQRLEKYIIADDVQLVDAAPHYGLLSVQGPRATEAVRQLDLGVEPPKKPMSFVLRKDSALGEVYLMNVARMGRCGFDLFVPTAALGAVADKLVGAVKAAGGRACGWQALEIARVEAGIPRFSADMDESNLAPETGIETRGISYAKGCYIGQEVIARIRTYGQVAKALSGLRLCGDIKAMPAKGDRLFKDGKEVGYITSAITSPTLKANITLGYVRREANEIGTELVVRTAQADCPATIVTLPFVNE